MLQAISTKIYPRPVALARVLLFQAAFENIRVQIHRDSCLRLDGNLSAKWDWDPGRNFVVLSSTSLFAFNA